MTGDAALAVWAGIGLAVAGLELSGRLVERFPTVADVFTVLVRPALGRAVVLLGWLWLGWHVFVRSTPG